MLAYLRLNVGPKADDWVGLAQFYKEEITEGDVDLHLGDMAPKVKEFSMTLHSELFWVLSRTPLTEAARIKDGNGRE